VHVVPSSIVPSQPALHVPSAQPSPVFREDLTSGVSGSMVQEDLTSGVSVSVVAKEVAVHPRPRKQRRRRTTRNLSFPPSVLPWPRERFCPSMHWPCCMHGRSTSRLPMQRPLPSCLPIQRLLTSLPSSQCLRTKWLPRLNLSPQRRWPPPRLNLSQCLFLLPSRPSGRLHPGHPRGGLSPGRPMDHLLRPGRPKGLLCLGHLHHI